MDPDTSPTNPATPQPPIAPTPPAPQQPVIQPQAAPVSPVPSPAVVAPQQQPYSQPTNPGGVAEQPTPVSGYGQPLSASSLNAGASHTKKLIFIVVVVIMAVVVLGAIVSLSKKSGESPVANLTNSIKGDDAVVNRSEGTLDLSTLIDAQETIKSQDIKAKLNQQINQSDGTSFMVTKIERNWVSSRSQSPYSKPEASKELVKVTLVAGNRNKTDAIFFANNAYKLVNAAGGLRESVYVFEDDIADVLRGQEIQPGKQISGSLLVKVDKNEQLAKLVTEEKYRNYSTSEDAIIKVEVSLQ